MPASSRLLLQLLLLLLMLMCSINGVESDFLLVIAAHGTLNDLTALNGVPLGRQTRPG